MKSTVRDFWKMVYDWRSGVIVMLSSLEEGGKVIKPIVLQLWCILYYDGLMVGLCVVQ